MLNSSFPSILLYIKCWNIEHWCSSNIPFFSNTIILKCHVHGFFYTLLLLWLQLLSYGEGQKQSSPQICNFICPTVSYAVLSTLRWIQCLKELKSCKFTLIKDLENQDTGRYRAKLIFASFSPLKHRFLPTSSMKEDRTTNQIKYT